MNVDELECQNGRRRRLCVSASVDIMFTLEDNTMAIDFDLGDEDPVESEADNSQPLELIELLLSIFVIVALSDDSLYASSCKISGGAHA